MPPVPPGDDDPFVPGPNKTHWIRNNVTRKLFPADISLPPSWKGMSTTNLYLKPVEIAMLRDQGRIVYQAPTDSPAYSPDFDYND